MTLNADLIDDALATYRLTRLVTTDRVTQKLRDRLNERWGTKTVPTIPSGTRTVRTAFGELLTCDWCVSIYVGAAVAAVRTFAPRAWRPIARALASSAVAGVIGSTT